MSLVIRARALTLEVDGKSVDLNQGDQLPDGVDQEKVDALRTQGSVVSEQEWAVEVGVHLGHATEPPAAAVPSAGPVTPDVDVASVENLVEWLTDDKPKAGTVVDAAGDDPDRAAKLLEAEEAATGGQPRKTVAGPLQAIVDG